MKDLSKTRLAIILIVLLASLYCIYPTVAYYLQLRKEPTVSGPRPAATAPEPAAGNLQELAVWKENNPAVVAWQEQNKPYVEWEKRIDQLRLKAIPLGLDLLGGVDVTLALDRDKAISNRVQSLMDTFRRELEKEKITARIEPVENGKAFTLSLDDKKNARSVANIFTNYSAQIENPPTEAVLAGEAPVRIAPTEADLNRELRESIDGALKGIQERVDSLGVTQPRISLQGSDHIRVQVPGEKDPDKLISNVIRPANLEFRMVHPDSASLIDPATGKLRPEAQVPLGAEVVPGKLGNKNKQTGQIDFETMDFVVLKKTEVSGADLRTATVTYNPSDFQNQIQVSLEFNDAGTAKFGELTTQYANQERQLAIMLDGVVRSAPRINDPITDGRAAIYGGFSNEEATELSQILKAGSLKAPLMIESKRTVGATIGNESILSGVRALILGSVVIAAFMGLYYGTAGVIAIAALSLNILIVLAIMALSRATLTLSGIGGILLTIGMAVDANVLIYERMREELRAGRPLRQAINLGFNRAFGVILDSNLTTLLCALVLLQFTEGSVFGFALTMTFGLLANLFTGLTVTYALCVLWFNWTGGLSLGKLAMFKNADFDFIKIRWFSIGLSLAVIFISGLLITMRGGLNYGVDFAGGFRGEVSFTQPVAERQIVDALDSAGLKDPNIQKVTDRENYYIIDVKSAKAPADGGQSDLQYTEQQLRDTLAKTFPDTHHVELTTGFGSQTSSKFFELAIIVTVLSSIGVLLYMWFRFEWYFGVAAVIAMIHDLIIAVLVGTLWDVQISLEVVAGLMVLMGFSVNDTIVIFDRIREDARGVYGKSFKEICNLAMNQSISRTIITSGTVLLAVLVLYFVGGEGLRQFSKIYLIGIVAGTYSTGFFAAPLVYMWNEYRKNRPYIELSTKKKRVEAAKPIGRPVGAPRAVPGAR